ncbi:MAG: aminotransferase class IV [Gallionellaceae bacterium]
MEKDIFFNGDYYPQNTKLISVLDRGLCFGDGLFEVIRCIDGEMLLFTKHMNRMRESASSLHMEILFNNEELLNAAKALAEKNQVNDGELYLELTRGEAARYHLFPENIQPNFFMTLNPTRKMKPNCRELGVSVCIFPDTRGGYCHLKTINLLPNILGKEEAKKRGDYEALFYREHNSIRHITEGPSSSYFGVKDNVLYTPELDNILAGCTRNSIIDLAKDNGIEVVEKRILLDEYKAMDEAFLSSTVSEVMPVIKIDGNEIANGSPGALTLKLQKCYWEFMRTHLE